ncbi:FlaA1/EpsC-like NDP-sugar epimerase [Bacillus sp. SORGH_AS 510]|uniref:hypothetical protein n=1 Tax=Bacillus sp. SORGH_AS_0510 TaxID=3041771 RepID=UPI0027861B21|nr:hypothetical protein [Bacillus sp. SORGH_AS_0510]MDQ1147228.1 FlaA1/EpsC-like NDP-sugar epimerase [Bacillus sp. SORGH_AS_0510]
MIIFLSGILTLILAAIYTYQPKKISLVNQLSMFFIISMLLINSMTILSLDKNLIEYTHEKEGFFAFILYRDLVYPLLFLIYLNLYKQIKKDSIRVLLIIGMLATFFLIELTALKTKLLYYINWNLSLSVFLYLGFFVILVNVLKFLEKYEREEQL